MRKNWYIFTCELQCINRISQASNLHNTFSLNNKPSAKENSKGGKFLFKQFQKGAFFGGHQKQRGIIQRNV